MYSKPIPKRVFPEAVTEHAFVAEEFVSICTYFGGRILVTPAYYEQGIEGAISDCRLRVSAAERLQKALRLLPEGMTFRVFDAWRPIAVQQSLYDMFYGKIRAKHPEYTAQQLADETRHFVSPPSYDPEKPSVHNTGGAIDLTITDARTGEDLDMGTAFDDFTEASYTAHFEADEGSPVRAHRRLLFWCMEAAGFQNLPTEWWHFDYGDQFWSYYTGKPVMYKGIL